MGEPLAKNMFSASRDLGSRDLGVCARVGTCPFTLLMAETNTMVLVFGFSVHFSAGFEGKCGFSFVRKGFWFLVSVLGRTKLNHRGTKIRVFRVCFWAPFLPPFFPHFCRLFPLQALFTLPPLLPLFTSPSIPPFLTPGNFLFRYPSDLGTL